MGKIAVELERAYARRVALGAPGQTAARVLARGDGWTVDDVVCTFGPQDHPFEERHSHVSIAIVAAGSFQYRSAAGGELMAPGSLLLGNPGRYFECEHEHGTGDRCIAFRYTPEYFERLVANTRIRGIKTDFRVLRLPPLLALSPLIAHACAGLVDSVDAPCLRVPWEELSIKLAVQTVQLAAGLSCEANGDAPSAVARVTRIVRRIEHDPGARLGLGALAREAGLSPYHFLRIFERLTGMTPHQYLLRSRLREAAMQLAAESTRVLEVAFDCGFGDVSNFNRSFRAEFGVSPRVYRRQMAIRHHFTHQRKRTG